MCSVRVAALTMVVSPSSFPLGASTFDSLRAGMSTVKYALKPTLCAFDMGRSGNTFPQEPIGQIAAVK